MAVTDERVLSINAIRRTLPVICPDNFTLMRQNNSLAKLDNCLIETVEKLYNIFFINCPNGFSQAFYNFRLKDCSAYLQSKITELQSNAEKIATTVRDITHADQQTFIFIAERIQDLVFVSKFVSNQHIIKDNHTCLSSVIQLEGELKNLHEKIASEAGDHRLSLAKFEKIERDLRSFKISIENDEFDNLARVAQQLDLDLIS